jgi:hypothetical protein
MNTDKRGLKTTFLSAHSAFVSGLNQSFHGERGRLASCAAAGAKSPLLACVFFAA